ncbi:ras GEF [Phellopilus nigrolimitatus]|nr:ras GEF [Phellopilus nigrolimitatus]
MSSDEEGGNPIISRPQPLMKRPKSMVNDLRNCTTSIESPKSNRSTKGRASSNSGVSMMQAIRNHLNMPLSEAYGLPPKAARPSSQVSSDRSSTASSSFRLREDRFAGSPKQSKHGDLPTSATCASDGARGEPGPRLRDTTSSLLSSYSTFRSSVISSTSPASDDVIAAAQKYYTCMLNYLRLIDELPRCVRDTFGVKRLRNQLEQTIVLLEPVASDPKNEQTILLLDNTLMLVRKLLTDIQYLLNEHRLPMSLVVEEDELDSDGSSVEYDIVEPHEATLDEETPEQVESKRFQPGVRRVKSSLATLNGFSRKKTAAVSVDCTNKDVAENATLVGLPTPPESDADARSVHRPLLTHHPSETQETLVDYSQDFAAVSESLDAFRSIPLFANCSEVSVGKPADTTDVTYAQDGTLLAMSPSAIIEELCKEQSLAKIDKPGDGFIDMIYTNFRCWWTPQDFLCHLQDAYEASYMPSRKLTIVLLTRRWVMVYWEPCDKVVISGIRKFVGMALQDGQIATPIAVDMLTRLQRYLEKGGSATAREDMTIKIEKMPFKLLDIARDMPLERGDYNNVRLLEFNDHESCEELARQLTLKESDLYLQLTSPEVVNFFVHPGTDPEADKKLKLQRDFSSNVKRWATYSVLKRNNPAKRARTFAFFARLAKVCIRLRNYSSAHSIYNGLESVHLDSLVETKAELTSKGKKTMRGLPSAVPTVPVMATYAGKLQRLKEIKSSVYTSSKVDDSVQLINLSLFRGATRVIYAMESNRHSYYFKAHTPVQGYLDHILRLVPIDENEIHSMFLSLKQTEQASADERKAACFFNGRNRSNSITTPF